jgi:hypothetical protein
MTSSFPEFTTSQAQPLPNWLTAASVNLSLNSLNEPRSESMAEAIDPDASPPPSGLMIVQKREWLAWPPPWLRAGPCFSDGRLLMFASSSSTGLSAHSVPSRAAFALSM